MALYNYLYAKNTGGKWILRVEDTDVVGYLFQLLKTRATKARARFVARPAPYPVPLMESEKSLTGQAWNMTTVGTRHGPPFLAARSEG